jgi:hypothetical protein
MEEVTDQAGIQCPTSATFFLKGLKGKEDVFRQVSKRQSIARCWWLTPVILATWEAEIRRIAV